LRIQQGLKPSNRFFEGWLGRVRLTISHRQIALQAPEHADLKLKKRTP
jgi:hypothetical protein